MKRSKSSGESGGRTTAHPPDCATSHVLPGRGPRRRGVSTGAKRRRQTQDGGGHANAEQVGTRPTYIELRDKHHATMQEMKGLEAQTPHMTRGLLWTRVDAHTPPDVLYWCAQRAPVVLWTRVALAGGLDGQSVSECLRLALSVQCVVGRGGPGTRVGLLTGCTLYGFVHP